MSERNRLNWVNAVFHVANRKLVYLPGLPLPQLSQDDWRRLSPDTRQMFWDSAVALASRC